MTKAQLQEVLGTVMEKIMQSQMAEQLGCDRSATDQVMAMAALRMIHDIAANGFESGANYMADDYGYTCDDTEGDRSFRTPWTRASRRSRWRTLTFLST